MKKQLLICLTVSCLTVNAARSAETVVPYSKEVSVLDKSGKCVLQAHDYLQDKFSEGLITYSIIKDNKRLYGYMDKKGNVVIKPRFSFARSFSDGVAIVESVGSRYGIIDHIELAGNFQEGFAAACEKWGSGWGLIDTSGKWKIKPEFDDIGDVSEGLCVARSKDKFGYIDINGRWVIPPSFESAGKFNGGFAHVEKRGKWGFIDRTGKIRISPVYNFVMEGFRGNLATCAINTNKLPNTQVHMQSDESSDKLFVQMRAQKNFELLRPGDFLRPNLKFGLIDRIGKWVVEPKYDCIQPYSDGMRLVELDGKFGFLSADGREMVPLKYVDAGDYSDGVAIVSMRKLPHRSRMAEYDPEEASTEKDEVLSQTPLNLIEPVHLEAALVACKKAAEIKPDNATIYGDLAWLNYALNRNEESVAAYTKALSLKPKYMYLYLGRSKALIRLGRWAEADKDLSRCVETYYSKPVFGKYSPQIPFDEVNLLRGYVFLQEEKQDAALQAFRKRLFSPSQGNIKEVLQNVLLNFHGIRAQDLLPALEKNGELEVAESLILDSFNKVDFFDPKIIVYPKTLPELESARNSLEKKLESALKEQGESKYEKIKYLALTIQAIDQVVERKESRFQIEDVRRLRMRQIELFKELAKYTKYYTAHRESLIAKLKLADNFASTDDESCVALYKEIMNAQMAGAWAELAARNYGAFLKRNGKIAEGEKYLKAGKSSSVSEGSSYKYYWKIDTNHDPIITPMTGGNESSSQFFDLAAAALDLNFECTARYYAEKALRTEDSKLKSKIQNFLNTRMSGKAVAIKPVVRYAKSFGEQPYYFEGGESQKQACKDCIAESTDYLKPYVRLARILRNEGKYKEAEALLLSATLKNNAYLDAWIEMGLLYTWMGRKSDANNIFKKALLLDPDNQLAKVMIKQISSANALATN